MMSTSLGSLATRFIPSASCIASNNYWAVYTSSVDASTSREWGPWQIGPPPTSDCLPPGYLPYSTAFYSPAQCPSGYTPAVQIVNTLAGSLVETTQTCCPTGHNFKAQPTSNALFQDSPYLTTFLCTSIADHTEVASTVTRSSAGTLYETSYTWKKFDGTRGFNAYGVVVRFQSTDFQTTATSTFATTLSLTPVTGTPSSSQPTSSSLTISPSRSTGLSTGAKVGIGVGVSVGTLIILFTLVICFMTRKRRIARARNIANAVAAPVEMPAVQSLGEDTKLGKRYMAGGSQPVLELDGNPIQNRL
ncbi:hypothetical protein BDV96DRAFT_571110 [Lophiotrema nucula]|uniref:Mid2 domain-containing protein n=1 Tax=Lophiotrema nucula TaxID=690887 RepID=A0A6A5ZF79_9PLEO|nr:hypothetical protein BDV96DRAFT_571110 [Lophiotrema nucula]